MQIARSPGGKQEAACETQAVGNDASTQAIAEEEVVEEALQKLDAKVARNRKCNYLLTHLHFRDRMVTEVGSGDA